MLDKMNVQHVLPVNDLREHEESSECWCSPHNEEGGTLIVHNALDQREEIETGERKIQ